VVRVTTGLSSESNLHQREQQAQVRYYYVTPLWITLLMASSVVRVTIGFSSESNLQHRISRRQDTVYV
jgi:hypothetical protein